MLDGWWVSLPQKYYRELGTLVYIQQGSSWGLTLLFDVEVLSQSHQGVLTIPQAMVAFIAQDLTNVFSTVAEEFPGGSWRPLGLRVTFLGRKLGQTVPCFSYLSHTGQTHTKPTSKHQKPANLGIDSFVSGIDSFFFSLWGMFIFKQTNMSGRNLSNILDISLPEKLSVICRLYVNVLVDFVGECSGACRSWFRRWWYMV